MDRQPLGRATIVRGNALALGLADASVDLVVTSPPYFGLRSYQDGGEHYEGQIGDEATPAEFVDALVAATAEMVRVLKPSGSIWVNLGDKYSSTSTPGPQSANSTMTGGRHKGVDHVLPRRMTPGAPPKSLIGVPWRYALRCIDDIGLILRAEVIWSKPNGLPESVTDRVRRSHEQWFHFTKEPRYFSAVDEVREGYGAPAKPKGHLHSPTRCYDADVAGIIPQNPLGKLPGSVWTIATEPLRVPDHLGIDHFAAFPTEWPRRIITGWSPSGVCVECGEGRRPVAERDLNVPWHWEDRRALSESETRRWTGDFASALRERGISRGAVDSACGTNGMAGHWTTQAAQAAVPTPEQWRKIEHAFGVFDADLTSVVQKTERVKIPDGQVNGRPTTRTGQANSRSIHGVTANPAVSIAGYDCACPEPTAPTTPATILDPFGGTGTTALVAKALGRHGISVDMSADYCRLAQWRTNDPKQLAKAARREFKPSAEPIDGQGDLLDLLGGEPA